MTLNNLFYLFTSFLQSLPSLLALVACIIFAITRWKKHPKVSMVVTIGLGLLLVNAVVFLFVYNFVTNWIRTSMMESGASFMEVDKRMQTVYLVLAWISNSWIAVAFAVVLVGVFMRRKPTNELVET